MQKKMVDQLLELDQPGFFSFSSKSVRFVQNDSMCEGDFPLKLSQSRAAPSKLLSRCFGRHYLSLFFCSRRFPALKRFLSLIY